MKQLPNTQSALVLRTDFSDEAAWDSISHAIVAPVEGFRAYVDLVSDPDFDGVTAREAVALNPEGFPRTFMFIVDRTALSDPHHPILVLDLYHDPGRTFRVVPSQMWSVENNLSIANMDFFEFADSVDEGGVFRGFPES